MFLLLQLLEMIIPVMSGLYSVQVINYVKARKWKDGQVMCALDKANKTTALSSMQNCSLKCGRDGTCTGFNIKNSLTCDHTNTPVLASTPRTRPSVTTSIHLYWLQHQELVHLWGVQLQTGDDSTCLRLHVLPGWYLFLTSGLNQWRDGVYRCFVDLWPWELTAR